MLSVTKSVLLVKPLTRRLRIILPGKVADPNSPPCILACEKGKLFSYPAIS